GGGDVPAGGTRLAQAARPPGDGQRGDQLAAGDAGQQLVPRRLVVQVQQRPGGQHGRSQQRRGHQARAQLGQGDRHGGVAGPGAAVLLGDDQAGQAELAGQLLPHAGVVGLTGGDELADRGQRAALGHEPPHGVAQRLLLGGQHQAHEVPRFWVPTRSWLNGVLRSTPGSLDRPRTRSPMMLRWISLVPPAMAMPGTATMAVATALSSASWCSLPPAWKPASSSPSTSAAVAAANAPSSAAASLATEPRAPGIWPVMTSSRSSRANRATPRWRA